MSLMIAIAIAIECAIIWLMLLWTIEMDTERHEIDQLNGWCCQLQLIFDEMRCEESNKTKLTINE